MRLETSEATANDFLHQAAIAAPTPSRRITSRPIQNRFETRVRPKFNPFLFFSGIWR
jgi:hypothetical protein